MKGWRTIAFNAVTVVVTVAGIGLQYVGLLGLTEKQAAVAGLALTVVSALGNMYLRSITTTKMGVRGAKPDPMQGVQDAR